MCNCYGFNSEVGFPPPDMIDMFAHHKKTSVLTFRSVHKRDWNIHHYTPYSLLHLDHEKRFIASRKSRLHTSSYTPVTNTHTAWKWSVYFVSFILCCKLYAVKVTTISLFVTFNELILYQNDLYIIISTIVIFLYLNWINNYTKLPILTKFTLYADWLLATQSTHTHTHTIQLHIHLVYSGVRYMRPEHHTIQFLRLQC